MPVAIQVLLYCPYVPNNEVVMMSKRSIALSSKYICCASKYVCHSFYKYELKKSWKSKDFLLTQIEVIFRYF
jgi:hypothetical protein